MRPAVGDTVRVKDTWDVEHICTVRELLGTQFTAVYEYARPDGGWVERTMFAFYKDHGAGWEVQNELSTPQAERNAGQLL